jgi:hypothetical protein
MKENRNEIEIQSTPERVWEILTDLGKYPEWNPLLCRAEGRLAVGEKTFLTTRSASNDMNLLCTVTTLEPIRQFSWKFHVYLPLLFTGEHLFKIESINEIRFRFIDQEIFHGLLVPIQAKNLETYAKPAMIEMGKALKRKVENEKDSQN